MAAPKITASTRYFLPGTTKVIIIPTVANLASGPIRSEINGGLDVSDEVAAINGWLISSENIATPDLGRRFVQQVTGRLTAADSSIDFWADRGGVDIRGQLVRDQSTNICIMDGGDVTGRPMDTFKVVVSSVGKVREIEGVGRLTTQFSIRDFSENIAVPA